MSTRKADLILLLDEGAPVQASVPFKARGHTVLHHRDVLSAGASDDQVVATAIMYNAVLIATDGDMKAFTVIPPFLTGPISRI